MNEENTGEIRVMTFGTFDHFHAGHESYLKQAKELGTNLTVVIARDQTVQQIKGNKPDQNERQRLHAVEQSGIADKVTLGYKSDKYKVLKKFRPNIIALGYDQFAFTYRLKKAIIDLKLDAVIKRLKPYKPQVYKSSIIKQQMANDQS